MARYGRRYPAHRLFPQVIYRIPVPPSFDLRRPNQIPIGHRIVAIGRNNVTAPVVTTNSARAYGLRRPVVTAAHGRSYTASMRTTPVASSVQFRTYHPPVHTAGIARTTIYRFHVAPPASAPVARLYQHARPINNARQRVVFRPATPISNPAVPQSRAPQDTFRHHHVFLVTQNRRN